MESLLLVSPRLALLKLEERGRETENLSRAGGGGPGVGSGGARFAASWLGLSRALGGSLHSHGAGRLARAGGCAMCCNETRLADFSVLITTMKFKTSFAGAGNF